MSSINPSDRKRPRGPRDMHTAQETPSERKRPRGPRPLRPAQETPAPITSHVTSNTASPYADIVLPPGSGVAARRRKRAQLDSAPAVLPVLPPSIRRALPVPPGVQTLLRHPLPPLPRAVLQENRNITQAPAFRDEAASLVLNEPYDLRDESNRPTPRLMAHVFSINEHGLGGTFLTQAHVEMVSMQQRYCAVTRPGQALAQTQFRRNLKELEFSLSMARELEAYHEDPVGTRMANIGEAVMQRLRDAKGRVVFPGGIVGHDDAHAVMFEMTRHAQDVRLRIYNTGDGIENHHADPILPKRFQTYLEIENIDPRIVDQPEFIEMLLEFSMPTSTQTLQDRVTALYALLKALGDVAPAVNQWSNPQSAPNCAWEVLNAFNSAHVESVSLFKFDAFTQSRLLEHYMNDNGIMSPENLIDWDAGRYNDGDVIERLVLEANTRFERTEEKLRRLDGREHEPAQDLRTFIQDQRDAIHALTD